MRSSVAPNASDYRSASSGLRAMLTELRRSRRTVGAIYTGQHSELNLSAQREELARLFDGYWADAVPFDPAEAAAQAAQAG